MRRILLLACIVMLPVGLASEPYVVLVDWTEGRTLAGTTVLVMSPLADRFPFDVDACHRTLLLDILYEPREQPLAVPGVGEFAIGSEFLAEVWHGDARLSQQRIRQPAFGIGLGVVPEAGPHELRLSLANGANVSWELRVRARELVDELACKPRVFLNEAELDPVGANAGAQWVEILNAADVAVDVSRWEVREGAEVLAFVPEVAPLAPGGRLVVALVDAPREGVALALWDEFHGLRDPGATLTDLDDDARTWQRAPDGAEAWVFVAGTPDAPNGS